MYHCHSDYSLLDSCTKYQDYIELAKENNQPGISISEHGKPLNWTEKWAACKKAGIRYIHSVEIYLTETLDPDHKIRDNYHTVLMAKNMDGLLELNEAISKSCNSDHFYYTNRMSFEEFINLSSNIIATSACLASPLNKLDRSNEWFEKLLRRYDWLEIQPHIHPEQIAFNRKLLDLSRTYRIPLIAGTDTHSSSPYKAECRAVLLGSKHKSYGDEDSFDLTYKNRDELEDMFRRQDAIPETEWMQAIDNTNALMDLTEEIDLDTSIKYPILYGSREADSQKFIETVDHKLEEKLRNGVIPAEQESAFRDAVKEEMRVFQKLNMDGFMLSMSELISWCKSQGMAIGTARGSVGGSRVAYVTDIIDMNPETWRTVFSRFCNEDRVEIGDIDIDCVESDRPAIFRYITDRFGIDKTARVASFGTCQGKGVIDDVGRYLAFKWLETHTNTEDNPWSLNNVAKIKSEFEIDPEKTREKYPDLFYYYDGLLDTKISQSVHPAGIVISPISLQDHFGVFDKDGESCLMLDMENIHDYTGLAKYDFLILKTVQVIRDCCSYLGKPYPKTYEVDWNDQNVWSDMIKNPSGIFQFESNFAFDSLRKFKPTSIFDMSIVNACIRPSGDSYRNELLARKPHTNPSAMIDDLLKNNLGYLIYQEDTISFLQEICGLSGSESDNIRRAIGRKQKDRLDAALPHILEGYCSKSPQPRDVAESEAREFLQVIEDSASYQFGYNHSIAYCLLGYLCAYYRYYHPLEFITSFLNNAANDDDIRNGTNYANSVGIFVTMPKFGLSRSDYFFDREKNIIAKGLSSVKYMNSSISEELFNLAHEKQYVYFTDLLSDINKYTTVRTNQLDILIKLDFFSDFGNQRELLRIADLFYDLFKKGDAKKIARDRVDGSQLEHIIAKNSIGVTKTGQPSKTYTLVDVPAILHDVEDAVKAVHMEDLSDIVKMRNFADVMGYAGYTSGKEEDRRKLYIQEIYPATRRRDGKQFGYNILTRSIGSGKESRFTIFNKEYNADPVHKGDIIYCSAYRKEGQYYTMTGYRRVI